MVSRTRFSFISAKKSPGRRVGLLFIFQPTTRCTRYASLDSQRLLHQQPPTATLEILSDGEPQFAVFEIGLVLVAVAVCRRGWHLRARSKIITAKYCHLSLNRSLIAHQRKPNAQTNQILSCFDDNWLSEVELPFLNNITFRDSVPFQIKPREPSEVG